MPNTAVYCDMTDADVQNGYLQHGRFDWAWVDSWTDTSDCADLGPSEQMDQFHRFMTGVPGVKNGHPTLFIDTAVQSAEQCRGMQPLGVQAPMGPGLEVSATAPAGDVIIRYANNLLNQFGDIPVQFASGVAGTFSRFGGLASGYQPLSSLRRLVSEDVTASGNTACNFHRSGSDCDVLSPSFNSENNDAFVYGFFGDDNANGVAAYLGGSQFSTTTHAAPLRGLLNSVLALPAAGRTRRANQQRGYRGVEIGVYPGVGRRHRRHLPGFDRRVYPAARGDSLQRQ